MLACAVAAETPVEAARQYTTAHHEKLTQEFSEFLSIPNVAADPANLRRNADLLIEMLRTRSVESRLLSIPGAPPIVYGQITVPGAQHTIVFFAHYDGQPVTPSEWEGGSPFTPEIREVDGEPRIYARSAGMTRQPPFNSRRLMRCMLPRSRYGQTFDSCGKARKKLGLRTWNRSLMPTGTFTWFEKPERSACDDSMIVFDSLCSSLLLALDESGV